MKDKQTERQLQSTSLVVNGRASHSQYVRNNLVVPSFQAKSQMPRITGRQLSAARKLNRGERQPHWHRQEQYFVVFFPHIFEL